MDFVAIDIETANSNGDSVCEIGLVKFESGIEVSSWSKIIKPANSSELMSINYSTHGISQEEINEAPEFSEVWKEFSDYIDGLPIIAHGATQDLSKIFKSAQSAMDDSWSFPSSEYFCSLVLSRHSSSIDLESYSLRAIAERLSIESPNIVRNGLVVHSAESDARAAGLIAISIASNSGQGSLRELATSLGISPGVIEKRAISKKSVSSSTFHTWKKINATDYGALKASLESTGETFVDHPLSGKSFVLTLSLEAMSEEEFVLACALINAEVKSGVSAKLNFLIEGDDPTGKYTRGKTSKSTKARQLISEKNAPIDIIDEAKFIGLIGPDVIEASKVLAKSRSSVQQSPQKNQHRPKGANPSKIKNRQSQEAAEANYRAFLRNPEWSEGKVIHGQRVSFTQLDYEDESKLTKACSAAGLEVTKSVSKKVDLLVIADSGYKNSAKLRDAIQKGIPACLLSHFLKANPELSSVSGVRRKLTWKNFFS